MKTIIWNSYDQFFKGNNLFTTEKYLFEIWNGDFIRLGNTFFSLPNTLQHFPTTYTVRLCIYTICSKSLFSWFQGYFTSFRVGHPPIHNKSSCSNTVSLVSNFNTRFFKGFGCMGRETFFLVGMHSNLVQTNFIEQKN